MPPHRLPGSVRARLGAALLVLGACGPLLWLWGFSVDDAWIVSRTAQHFALGQGARFDVTRPATDAVTPLGFAHLLGFGARALGLEPFALARGLGLAGWLGCVLAVARRTTPARGPRLLLVAVGLVGLVPLHAWAGAGLETPLVACAFTWGALSATRSERRGRWGVVGLSAAAAWRPELGPAACVAAAVLPRAATRGERLGRAGAVGILPLCVVGLRLAWFGSPWPLSFVAKAPELGAGLRYALGGLFLAGPFGWLVARSAGRAWWRAGAVLLAHTLAMTLCGGDWMPLYRLWVPLLPWWLAETSARPGAPRAREWLGCALASAGPCLLALGLGSEARLVLERRELWLELARPALADARVVAAVDVGWVGRATSARLVDLGGVTDPSVARLPGGHTSKHLGAGFLAAREVDTWILRAFDPVDLDAPLERLQPVYRTDRGLLEGAAALGFEGCATWSVPGTGTSYVVARDRRFARERGGGSAPRGAAPWGSAP